jgi:solute carrier family 6 serotonin transporter-like protein 4
MSIVQAIAIANVVNFKDLELKDYQFPWWSVYVGWMVSLSSLACIPIYAGYLLLATEGSFYTVSMDISVCVIIAFHSFCSET